MSATLAIVTLMLMRSETWAIKSLMNIDKNLCATAVVSIGCPYSAAYECARKKKVAFVKKKDKKL